MNGYQLLNEVGTGGTLSSLFTILSLFTENVKISWQDDDALVDHDDTESIASTNASERMTTRPPIRVRTRRSDSDVSRMNLDLTTSPEALSPRPRGRGASVSSSGSTIHADDYASPPRRRSASRGPSISGTSSHSNQTAYARRRPLPGAEAHSSYGVIARATEDSTLAVIPAEAFRRLTKKFPKAAAHIVQGVSYDPLAHLNVRLTLALSNIDKILSRDIQCSAQLPRVDHRGPAHGKGYQ